MTDYITTNEGFLTASKLKMLYRCPAVFEAKYLKKTIPDTRTSALDIGTAFDDWVTLGDEGFAEKWSICEPRKKRTEDNQLTNGDGKVFYALSKVAHEQPLFELKCETLEKQVSIETEFLGVPVRGTIDRMGECKLGMCIRDTKTSALALDDRLNFKISDLDYPMQMAFYRMLVFKSDGVKLPCFLDIFTKPTGSSGSTYQVIEIPTEILDAEEMRIVKLIEDYKRYKKNGNFPHHRQVGLGDHMCPALSYCPGRIQTDIKTFN